MKITKLPIKYNFSTRNGIPIEYIVVHDTGNKRVGADAEAHYRYFNKPGVNASAHYFVDNKEVIQIIPDHLSAWHCGDGKGRYGITNSNSIGIEICINEDGNYNVAVNKTVELVNFLMQKYNVPANNVVRHYDASRKLCPGSMSENNWQKWNEFKKRLQGKQEGIRVNIKGRVQYIDGVFKNDKNYVSIREMAEALGHEVIWDKGTKTVVIR